MNPLKRLLQYGTVLILMLSVCQAQTPDFYKKIARVTWVVKSLDRPLEGWTRLGLSNVHRLGPLAYKGKYHDQAISGTLRMATGQFGALTVDMVQPPATSEAYNSFLARRGDGVFSIVHEVTNSEAMSKELERMRALGVEVLEQVEFEIDNHPVSFTFFDTEPKGKYVLGLVNWPGGAPAASATDRPSHIAFVVREMESVSAFWASIGFPAVKLVHASPRDDGTYHGKPLLLPFEVGWDNHTRPGAEWIVPPQTPANCYNDFLTIHGEGVQHVGVLVEDLEQGVAEYRQLGYQVLQTGAWGENGKKGSGRYAYMDTDSIGGVSVELIRAIK
jgi:catechol 2,3-dioxygenase-like lactoylglutathione lyase family enzyme